MPAKRTPKPAAEPETPEPAVTPEAPEASDGSNGPDGSEGSEGSDEETAPLNRAERRAKAKGKTPSQGVAVRGKVVGSRGPAASQRMWANRRSG